MSYSIIDKGQISKAVIVNNENMSESKSHFKVVRMVTIQNVITLMMCLQWKILFNLLIHFAKPFLKITKSNKSAITGTYYN